MTGDLTGKLALITGGRQGIGRGIVDLFLNEGAHVVACGRGPQPDDLPPEVRWHSCDVSQSAQVDAMFSAIGGVDILVNNAGVQVEKTVLESSDDDWDLVMGANARGVFNCSRAALQTMLAAGGTIINIGSISGNVADPSMALYNASKAFVHGLTRAIAVDHGPQVRCNAICPGWINTGMAEAAFALAKDPAQAQADALARHAARRFGEPGDIAAMALWLASDRSKFVTGQCFTVDGGLTAASPLQPGLF